MRISLRGTLTVLTAGLLMSTAAMAQISPPCGDLNNDGNTNVVDAVIMSQCLVGGGICPPVSPGPLCGTGSLISCGDVFGDGDITVAGLTADIAALALKLTGGATLFEGCEGPGPDLAGCPGLVTIPSSTITSNQTWPAGCDIRLGGSVFVDNGATLTIEPGAVIKGQVGSVDPPALFILPGAKIDAQGTPSAPIIMTSSASPGSRDIGDWGGLNINGRSTVNTPGCTAFGEGVPTPFGGCDENDFSGIVTFTRVEFAGILFTPNNELNIITMNGLGSQTQINFTQAHAGADDCHEWFGGTSNHKNMISSACGDDGFDWQLGYTGFVQNALFFQEGTLTDPNADSRGIEADNSEFDNFATPISDPTFCNFTLIGADGQPGANAGSDSGILLRRGTRGQMANAIVQNFTDSGFEIRDISTSQQACIDANNDGIPEAITGELIVRSSVFADNGSGGVEHAKDNDPLVGSCTTNAECTGAGTPAGCCTGPGTGSCVLNPNCECTSPELYGFFVSDFDVVPANGAGTTSTGISNLYPALDSSFCTGSGTPEPCCSGAGSGSCREIPVVVPSFTGPVPPVYDCSQFDGFFDSLTSIGAVDPGASCTSAGCDWVTRPWAGFAID